MEDRIRLTDEVLGDEGALKALNADSVEIRLCRAGRAAHDTVVGVPGQWRRVMATLQWTAKMPALRVSVVSPVNEEVLADAPKFASLLALLPHVLWRLEVPSAYPGNRWFQMVRMIDEVCEEKGIALALSDPMSVLDGPFREDSPVLSNSRLTLIEQGGFWAQAGTSLRLPRRQIELQRLAFTRKGLSNVGLKLSLFGFPIQDLPQCLGGLGQAMPSRAYLFGKECGGCSRRLKCSGVPREVGMLLSDDSDVCPLPFWTGMVAKPRVAILAKEPTIHQRFQMMLKMWEGMGAIRCSMTETPDFILIGSLEEASEHVTRELLDSGVRVVVCDHSTNASFADLALRFDPNGRRFRHVDWWPHPHFLLLSTVPERLHDYRRARIPLRWIRFVHWPERTRSSTLPFASTGWYRPNGDESEAYLQDKILGARFVVLDRVVGTRFHEIMGLVGACGRVALCLSSLSARFWIEHKHNGLLARSPKDVSKWIERMESEPELLAQLTLNARRVSRSRTVRELGSSLFHGFA